LASAFLVQVQHIIWGIRSGTAMLLFIQPDNKSFIKIGNELKMRFNLKIFTGNKFCLFNYATKETGGYVDIDWFRTDASLKN
jgi:hypothetical protein